MSATKKQIALIERLMSAGALIPESHSGNPDFSMMESVHLADEFIKANIGLLHGKIAKYKYATPNKIFQ